MSDYPLNPPGSNTQEHHTQQQLQEQQQQSHQNGPALASSNNTDLDLSSSQTDSSSSADENYHHHHYHHHFHHSLSNSQQQQQQLQQQPQQQQQHPPPPPPPLRESCSNTPTTADPSGTQTPRAPLSSFITDNEDDNLPLDPPPQYNSSTFHNQQQHQHHPNNLNLDSKTSSQTNSNSAALAQSPSTPTSENIPLSLAKNDPARPKKRKHPVNGLLPNTNTGLASSFSSATTTTTTTPTAASYSSPTYFPQRRRPLSRASSPPPVSLGHHHHAANGGQLGSPSDSSLGSDSSDSYFLPFATSSLSSASSTTSLAHPNSHHHSTTTPTKHANGNSGYLSSSSSHPYPTTTTTGTSNSHHHPYSFNFVPSSSSSSSPRRSRRWRPRSSRSSRFYPKTLLVSLLRRYCSIHTLPSLTTILFCLVLFGVFAASVTALLIHILNPDKEPIPWRSYCQDQPPFPHALADSLAPVDVFVGVFSIDSAYERRHLIRSTYARHTRPLDPHTGRPSHHVQLKFILGKPRTNHARRVALEMETYNDIVVLDEAENMNRGKTHTFFTWAAENATVPVYYSPPVPPAGRVERVGVAFKKADYVVKADDDAFIVLSELERHLRVAPREKTYWGYLIRNLFMGGECYALSADLVQYVANHAPLLSYTSGAEDKKVAQWMRLHPDASSINWVTERCWIYDHPKAGTAYSHGFLFPDEVERVRLEGSRGMTEEEKIKRGGERAQSYSTVSRWKETYMAPRPDMTMEEEVEALVEGGGIWAHEGWVETPSEDALVRSDKIWLEADDSRLKPRTPSSYSSQQKQIDSSFDSSHDYDDDDDDQDSPYNRVPHTLLRSPADYQIDDQQHAPMYKRAVSWLQAAAAAPDSNPNSSNNKTSSSSSEDANNDRYDIDPGTLPKQHHAQMPVADPSLARRRLVPAPTLRYDASRLSLQQRRYLNLPYGGTVVVHYLKRHEWFYETALALLGRTKTWDQGTEAPAYDPRYLVSSSQPPSSSSSSSPSSSNSPATVPNGYNNNNVYSPSSIEVSAAPKWEGVGVVHALDDLWGGARMWGSPIVRSDGYIVEGREKPRLVVEEQQRPNSNHKNNPVKRPSTIPFGSGSGSSSPSSSSSSSSNNNSNNNNKQDETEQPTGYFGRYKEAPKMGFARPSTGNNNKSKSPNTGNDGGLNFQKDHHDIQLDLDNDGKFGPEDDDDDDYSTDLSNDQVDSIDESTMHSEEQDFTQSEQLQEQDESLEEASIHESPSSSSFLGSESTLPSPATSSKSKKKQASSSSSLWSSQPHPFESSSL